MFQQLVPLLRQRSVLLTLASVEDDQIRVNVIPKKLKEGENNALTTPMSFTGTAAELDEQLPNAIASFVASHLELKNTLARAREEMDAAARAAQEEARNKAKEQQETFLGIGREGRPGRGGRTKEGAGTTQDAWSLRSPCWASTGARVHKSCAGSCHCDPCVSNGDCICPHERRRGRDSG
jgi:PRTRC genetic system protein E